MKSFAATLLGASAVADEYDHYHNEYNGEGYASSADLTLPNFDEQVNNFQYRDTLFGTENYQLQVAKTANMLIATEALRLSTANLQNRVEYAQALCDQNASDIDENASDIADNQDQIEKNKWALQKTADRLDDLENGYSDLEEDKDVDRRVIEKMCHQYAYAESIPKECEPIIGGLAGPIDYAWNWPQDDCPGAVPLPPTPSFCFNNRIYQRRAIEKLGVGGRGTVPGAHVTADARRVPLERIRCNARLADWSNLPEIPNEDEVDPCHEAATAVHPVSVGAGPRLASVTELHIHLGEQLRRGVLDLHRRNEKILVVTRKHTYKSPPQSLIRQTIPATLFVGGTKHNTVPGLSKTVSIGPIEHPHQHKIRENDQTGYV